MGQVVVQPKCLLIGGSGFIGTHLARRLVDSGRGVTVLDRSIPAETGRVAGVKYVSGDFADSQVLETLVANHDEVVHLAYATVPNTSFDNPLADLDQNLLPAVQLFEIVARKGVRLLLVSSGGTVYGEALSELIEEDHPTNPISPYGVTKLTLEKYACLYAVTRGLDVVVVRPANPYGQGQKPFAGQGFVSTAMALALQGKNITIFGKSGTVRDYIYIEDLTEGIFVALDCGRSGQVYNIGSSVGRSNLEVIHAMKSLLRDAGFDVRVDHADKRVFDVKVNVLDCNKLRSLGWKPSVSFEQGLIRLLAWLRE